jgi:hypothetical protein
MCLHGKSAADKTVQVHVKVQVQVQAADRRRFRDIRGIRGLFLDFPLS